MNLLLDTHALLWWLDDNPELSSDAREAIENPKSIVYVSVATAWEISIKKASGKLEAPDQIEECISSNDFQTLPITSAHATAAGQLPQHHTDIFDRMLVAQAMIENLTLVTRDKRIMRYKVATLTA